jgi:hypothetical protein
MPSAIHCRTICGVEAAAAPTWTLSVTTDPGTTSTGWSGDADCADGSFTLSASRQCYARLSAAFTDETIVPGVTAVRAVHMTELRARIDAQRVRFGLSPFVWTTPAPSAGVTALAVHVAELRTALAQAYIAAGRPEPEYGSPPPSPGTVIRAADVTVLRDAVRALE